ncbi:MAG: hypothetical protein ACKVUT_17305 [Gaiella sp.]
MNLQRGHWKVPCRHSMPAPQRQQGSVAAWLPGVGAAAGGGVSATVVATGSMVEG